MILDTHGSTGGPRYMREIGTPKIGSHINKMTKDYHKLEDMFQKKGHFSIAFMQN
jgi:hypothetical protein